MSTFIMMGSYTKEAINNISTDRTKKATELVTKFGGEIRFIYALLGEKDLHITADFPNMKQALRASIALNKLTGITFSTSEAITAAEFDAIMEEV